MTITCSWKHMRAHFSVFIRMYNNWHINIKEFKLSEHVGGCSATFPSPFPKCAHFSCLHLRSRNILQIRLAETWSPGYGESMKMKYFWNKFSCIAFDSRTYRGTQHTWSDEKILQILSFVKRWVIFFIKKIWTLLELHRNKFLIHFENCFDQSWELHKVVFFSIFMEFDSKSNFPLRLHWNMISKKWFRVKFITGMPILLHISIEKCFLFWFCYIQMNNFKVMLYAVQCGRKWTKISFRNESK